MNKIVRAQYYANEVCNVVQLLAAFVASFIAVVIGVLAILDPTIGRTMNHHPPCRSVVHFPDCQIKLQSHP